ncbi:hypothetical protein QYE76_004295 [Lolium multiflorum]|uniref:Uncharacterized protein n=1 Tax=Lolium multiflorum TaxID=4521 RepID=A0AAD8RRY8_LOLMU|nr:hypothetical protein QYE76_004295 [Lolium multiflorum]
MSSRGARIFNAADIDAEFRTGVAAAAAASQEWLVVPPAGEFGRHRIMEMTGLPARDLRVLDPLLSYPSTILGRNRAIVLKLEHVKAIVTAVEVLVRDPSNPRLQPFLHARLALPMFAQGPRFCWPGPDETEQGGHGNVPMPELGTPGCAKKQPFEFKTLALEKEAYLALDELATRVSTHNLEHVR